MPNVRIEWIILGVLIVVNAVLLFVFVRKRLQKAAQLAATPVRCDTCRHFDFEEGQAALDKYPLARIAYQAITPNEAMQKFDSEGMPIPVDNPLSAKDDTFKTLGACMLDACLRLGCDKCERWAAQVDRIPMPISAKNLLRKTSSSSNTSSSSGKASV